MSGLVDEQDENPFGVYVPELRDQLPPERVRPKDDHPLVPWKEPSHAGQWVDVDHAREQLNRFEQRFQEELPGLLLPNLRRGHLVVVTGPVGMGKTTLIHRCVHLAHEYLDELRQQLDERSQPRFAPELVVAMAGGYDNHSREVSWDASGDFAETPQINAVIRDKIVEALEEEFPDVPLDPSLTGNDVRRAFTGISRLLARQNRLLLAIVPHIDWRDAGGDVRTKFLRTWLSHAQSRIMLFVEISHQNPRTASEVIAELPVNTAVTHLSLGLLAVEDTVKFTQAARGSHPDQENDPPLPTIPGRSADEDPWRLTDVRYLRRECFRLAEAQRLAGGRVRVTATDLTAPTINLTSLSRNQPAPRSRPPGPA